MSSIRVSAFRWVPPFAQGLVRDLRVRWALEEASRPYDVRLIGSEDQASAAYRRLQPFGQVPAVEEEDGLALFESGAIVLRIAEASSALMPSGDDDCARTRTWMFAALNSIEPPITTLIVLGFRPPEEQEGLAPFREWTRQWVGRRLDELVAGLGGREHLVADRFTAADLLMTTVLRALRSTDLVESRPALAAYQRRHEARPAFAKALDGQLSTFEANKPPTA